jgi:hypothetical protein
MTRLLIALWLLCESAHAQFMTGGWDYEARKWQVMVSTNSGTLSAKAYTVGTTFLQSTKRWGVRPYLGRVNLYLGDNTNAMVCPIITDWFSVTLTVDQLTAFVSTDYSEATGLTGNTTTKSLAINSLTPGFDLSAQTSITNLHLAVYNRSASSQSGYCIGLAYTVGPTLVGLPISYANTTYLEIGTIANQVSVADTNGTGLYVATRRSNARAIYKNGSSILTSAAAAAGTLGGGQPYVHAEGATTGAASLWTDRALSYYCYGFGVPDERQAAYYRAVLNVQQAYGRQ